MSEFIFWLQPELCWSEALKIYFKWKLQWKFNTVQWKVGMLWLVGWRVWASLCCLLVIICVTCSSHYLVYGFLSTHLSWWYSPHIKVVEHKFHHDFTRRSMCASCIRRYSTEIIYSSPDEDFDFSDDETQQAGTGERWHAKPTRQRQTLSSNIIWYIEMDYFHILLCELRTYFNKSQRWLWKDKKKDDFPRFTLYDYVSLNPFFLLN